MEREILLGITGMQWEMIDDGEHSPEDAEAVEMVTSADYFFKMESIISCMMSRLEAIERLEKARLKLRGTGSLRS